MNMEYREGDGQMQNDEGKSYRIGEVAELLHLKTSVLRFWESEFPQIEPARTEKGQRVYTDKHISVLRRIQLLLHEQGMTIDGAKKVLEGQPADRAFMQTLEDELMEIRNILAGDAK